MIEGVYNVRDFGAKGDSGFGSSSQLIGTPDDGAFRATIDAMKGPGRLGGTMVVPEGKYRLTKTLKIDRSIRIVGVGPGGLWNPAQLLFEPGIGPAIHVVGDASLASFGEKGRTGDYASIENLRIQGSGSNAQKTLGDHGIFSETFVELSGLYIGYFGGDGVYIHGSTLGDQINPVATNASHWRMSGCRVENNGANGLHLKGNDANAGFSQACDFRNNKDWGVLDESFLGNLHIAHHTSANGAGPYRVKGGVNHTCYLGCYSEADQGPSDLSGSNGFIEGGDHGGGVVGGPHRTGSTTFATMVGWIDKSLPSWMGTLHIQANQSARQNHPHVFIGGKQGPNMGNNVFRQFEVGEDGHVAVGNEKPHSAAILQVSSSDWDLATKRGTHPPRGAIVAPRLTQASIDAIGAKPEGLEVYNLTLHKKQYWDGSRWVTF